MLFDSAESILRGSAPSSPMNLSGSDLHDHSESWPPKNTQNDDEESDVGR